MNQDSINLVSMARKMETFEQRLQDMEKCNIRVTGLWVCWISSEVRRRWVPCCMVWLCVGSDWCISSDICCSVYRVCVHCRPKPTCWRTCVCCWARRVTMTSEVTSSRWWSADWTLTGRRVRRPLSVPSVSCRCSWTRTWCVAVSFHQPRFFSLSRPASK